MYVEPIPLAALVPIADTCRHRHVHHLDWPARGHFALRLPTRQPEINHSPFCCNTNRHEMLRTPSAFFLPA